MRRIVPFLLLLSQLWSCAPALSTFPESRELFADGQELWEIHLGRGDSGLFAGLLLLDRKGDQLEAVLLDATGIKLLEETVTAGGEVKIVSALPTVRDKRLPAFLGKGLHRLFFNVANLGGEPCRPDGWGELCFGVNDRGTLVKFRKIGPFVLWSADYLINNYDAKAISGAELRSGWLVPHIRLRKSGAPARPPGNADENE